MSYRTAKIWVKRYLVKTQPCALCSEGTSFDLVPVKVGLFPKDINYWHWICRRCTMVTDGRLEKLVLRNKCKPRRRRQLKLPFGQPEGSSSPNWKHENIGYAAAHYRVQRERGKPNFCEVCETTTAKSFDWANVNQLYHDPYDYVRLCRSCHFSFDGTGLYSKKPKKEQA